jgi:hypothetical protein
MPSASGLSRDQRIRCRDRVVQAARLTLANKEHTHYTEGPLRWDGIKNRRNAEIGQFPSIRTEPGPFYLAYNYRPDVLQIRRYI